ncbi:MAG: hypothetical protein CSA34_06535 [Desulfobulbus propionicus]|nr:MAG: hypothetical protein CSA34_06535 [Desulfobulbus propionicus]
MTLVFHAKQTVKVVLSGVFIVFVFSASGCTGDTLVLNPPADSSLLGMVIHFDEPMGYLLLSEKDSDDFDKKAIELGRVIMSKNDLEDKHSIFNKYPREYFKPDMSFTIIGSFWVRRGWFTRGFVSDRHEVILEDENGIRSACGLWEIDSIETTLKGELK